MLEGARIMNENCSVRVHTAYVYCPVKSQIISVKQTRAIPLLYAPLIYGMETLYFNLLTIHTPKGNVLGVLNKYTEYSKVFFHFLKKSRYNVFYGYI